MSLLSLEICEECHHIRDDHGSEYEHDNNGTAVSFAEPCLVPGCDCPDFQPESGIDAIDAIEVS